jgi:hypothetical protein
MNKLSKGAKLSLCILVVIVGLLVSCTQTKKKKTTIYDCNKKINAMNIESLFIVKNYYDNISSSDFLYLSEPDDNFRFNGNVKSIKETVSETSIRFDEEYEEKLFVTNYEFDNNNNLILKEVENIGGNIDLSKEDFREYYVLNKYNYSTNGILINKIIKKIRGVNKNSKPDIEQWNYFYNNDNQLIKEIYKSPYQDSTVVKYDYFDNLLNEAFIYNTEGEKIINAIFNYDNENNCFIVRTAGTRWGSSELNEILGDPTEIIFYFDDNCKLKKITKVNRSGSEKNGFRKVYEKLELNKEGDPTNITSFTVNNLKNNDMIYHDDFDFSVMEYSMSKYFEYKYDNKNNWTYKKEGDNVYRRVIIYR